MQIVLTWIVLGIIVLLVLNQFRGNYPSLSAAQAKEFIEKQEPLVLDVRSEAEQQSGIIAGATRIPLPLIKQRLAELPRERPVLVYCASGIRSRMAAGILKAAGLAVFNLSGGISAWRAVGYPLSSPK